MKKPRRVTASAFIFLFCLNFTCELGVIYICQSLKTYIKQQKSNVAQQDSQSDKSPPGGVELCNYSRKPEYKNNQSIHNGDGCVEYKQFYYNPCPTRETIQFLSDCRVVSDKEIEHGQFLIGCQQQRKYCGDGVQAERGFCAELFYGGYAHNHCQYGAGKKCGRYDTAHEQYNQGQRGEKSADGCYFALSAR